MKILHTSDWHLGRALYGRKRYEEFEAFLSWLSNALQQHSIDALIVAGDVFDTTTPSNRSQELYYQFLCRVAASPCRHVVVVAGNHDSPSFLNAPRELLKALHVHVIGSAPQDLAEEVLVLNHNGTAELIVCAVPYLRDRDIRVAEAGESIEDKERKLVEGIRDHYATVVRIAEQKRTELGAQIPIVATGHLFAAGGKTEEGDGVRDLYVGSLAQVSAGIFPAVLDYVALGHLHVPQQVRGSQTIRYSGSPIPMGFGEAGQKKSVCIVELGKGAGIVQVLPVPVFQKLERIHGDWTTLSNRLLELSAQTDSVWLEIVYQGHEICGDLRDRVENLVAGTPLEILRVKNQRTVQNTQLPDTQSLEDLSPEDMLERCFTQDNTPMEQRGEMRNAYREILAALHADDPNAQ